MKKGFTLIELLVVISVMGILATVGLNTFPGAIAKARDSQRVDDARKIIAAVHSFFTDKDKYPPTSSGACNPGWCDSRGGTSWIPDLVPSYLPNVPVDPKNTTPPNLVYYYTTDGDDYCLQVSQERDASTSRNYRSNQNPWYLRFGPYGPNGGLCGSR